MNLAHIDNWLELLAVLLVALVGGAATGLPGIIRLRAEIRKIRTEAEATAKTAAATAETAKASATKDDIASLAIQASAAGKDNSRLRDELRKLDDDRNELEQKMEDMRLEFERRIADLRESYEKRIADLQTEVERLRSIMKKYGIDPDSPQHLTGASGPVRKPRPKAS